MAQILPDEVVVRPIIRLLQGELEERRAATRDAQALDVALEDLLIHSAQLLAAFLIPPQPHHQPLHKDVAGDLRPLQQLQFHHRPRGRALLRGLWRQRLREDFGGANVRGPAHHVAFVHLRALLAAATGVRQSHSYITPESEP